MAPKKAVKRTAETEKMTVAKKIKVVDPVADMCAAVETAIGSADIPEKCRQMLSSSVSVSLGVLKDERHEFQNSTIDLIRRVLSGLQTDFEKSLQEADEALNNVNSEKASFETAQKTAEDQNTAKQTELEEKQATLTELQKNVQAASQKLAEATTTQKSVQSELGSLEDTKKVYEQVIAEDFAKLKTGIFENKEDAKKHIAVLTPLCKKMDLNDSLMLALPTAVSKSPEARGSFDVMVMDEAEKELNAYIALLGQKLDSREATIAEHVAIVEAAQEAHNVAEQEMQKVSAEVKEVQAERKNFEFVFKESKRSLREFATTLKLAEVEKADAQRRLTEFQNGPLAAFQTLLDRTAPEQPVATAPAEEVLELPTPSRATVDV